MKKIILSRTDNLGDVMLTLPLAGALKERYPDVKIYFIGKAYTQALIEQARFIDVFLDKEEIIQKPSLLSEVKADAIIFVFPDRKLAQIAYKAHIPLRIGTSHRFWHWIFCNKRVDFSRKNAQIHEAQLNFRLLEGLGIFVSPNMEMIERWYGFSAPMLPQEFQLLLSKEKLNIILHPKSKGSAREWHISSYEQLCLQNSGIQFFVTGTEAEGRQILAEKPEIFALPNVVNMTGKFSLSQLIGFISTCDGLVASGTGPLHIAAALGVHALGIYPPIEPIHPARWQPIGNKAQVLVLDKNCSDCRRSEKCTCMWAISVAEVSKEIIQWEKKPTFTDT